LTQNSTLYSGDTDESHLGCMDSMEGWEFDPTIKFLAVNLKYGI
jgi:hypothetical protein